MTQCRETSCYLHRCNIIRRHTSNWSWTSIFSSIECKCTFSRFYPYLRQQMKLVLTLLEILFSCGACVFVPCFFVSCTDVPGDKDNRWMMLHQKCTYTCIQEDVSRLRCLCAEYMCVCVYTCFCKREHLSLCWDKLPRHSISYISIKLHNNIPSNKWKFIRQ